MVLFLHVSDIHFRSSSERVTDIDRDLRNELLADAKEFAETSGQPDGILASGDIAFSGKSDEYKIAEDWICDLSTRIGLEGVGVWCVPGNHDVDQGRVKGSGLLTQLHRTIRNASEADIDSVLADLLNDDTAAGPLFSTIEEYNLCFGRKFECEVTPTQPFWTEDFSLDDSSTLRIFGANSTLVSDHQDNHFKKIVVGRYQLPDRQEGVTTLLLCHHPPNWWMDSEQLSDDIERRCHLHLYGHKHRHTLKRIDDCVVLSSGAVHPERREQGWDPRYNWVRLEVDSSGEGRRLEVEVFPRVWSSQHARFIPDTNSCYGQPSIRHSLPLDPWEAPTTVSAEVGGDLDWEREALGEEGNSMKKSRLLTYRFFELPHVKRLDIVHALGLLRDEDEGLTDTDLLQRILRRAREMGVLADLWDQVQTQHGDGEFTDNPYRSGEQAS